MPNFGHLFPDLRDCHLVLVMPITSIIEILYDLGSYAQFFTCDKEKGWIARLSGPGLSPQLQTWNVSKKLRCTVKTLPEDRCKAGNLP